MGKYGVHSGIGEAKRLKVDGKYVPNAKMLRYLDFKTNFINGKTAASASGMQTTAGEGIRAYVFGSAADAALRFEEIVPENIPRNARMDVTVYYTASGTAVGGNQVYTGSGIVWDIDYKAVDLFTSGTTVFNYNYILSGAYSNATATGSWGYQSTSGSSIGTLSGTVSSATITIPASKVRANSYIHMILYRDVGESADDFSYSAFLICGKVEYVDRGDK